MFDKQLSLLGTEVPQFSTGHVNHYPLEYTQANTTFGQHEVVQFRLSKIIWFRVKTKNMVTIMPPASRRSLVALATKTN